MNSRLFRAIGLTALTFCLLLPPANAREKEASASQNGQCKCEAVSGMPQHAVKHKAGPVKKVLKGLGSELHAEASDFMKDMVFVFSVQDIDPYDTPPPTDKPYHAYEIQLVDGETASVIKFPDGSLRVSGSTFDGTSICPKGDGTFDVAYTNGAHGTLKPLPGGGCRIERPDNTVTTFSKTASGAYSITNTGSGYVGTAEPDRTGLSWQIGMPTF